MAVMMNNSSLVLVPESGGIQKKERILQKHQIPVRLPMELIVEILARLPNIKSLIRCKVVCKSWYALLSKPDPYFIRLYSQKTPPSSTPNVLIQLFDSNVLHIDSADFSLTHTSVSKFSLAFLNDPNVRIRASSNGLLCCASVNNLGVYYVCNPVTRQFRLLPRVTTTMTRHPWNVGLAFHQSSWKFHVLLTGFFEPDLPQDQLVCLLFDSDTNSWNRILVPLYETRSRELYKRSSSGEDFCTKIVVLGTSMYWLVPTHTYLLAFDLESLVARKIPTPGRSLKAIMFLMETDGLLSLIQLTLTGRWMSVWVLEDSVSPKWVLEKKFHLWRITQDIAFPISRSKSMVLIAYPKEVVTYDWRHNAWRKICDGAIHGEDSWYTDPPYYFYTLTFRSTLFPC